MIFFKRSSLLNSMFSCLLTSLDIQTVVIWFQLIKRTIYEKHSGLTVKYSADICWRRVIRNHDIVFLERWILLIVLLSSVSFERKKKRKSRLNTRPNLAACPLNWRFSTCKTSWWVWLQNLCYGILNWAMTILAEGCSLLNFADPLCGLSYRQMQSCNSLLARYHIRRYDIPNFRNNASLQFARLSNNSAWLSPLHGAGGVRQSMPSTLESKGLHWLPS